jgi:hypothetical protein
MEIVTPLNKGKGLSQQQVMKDVPLIATILRKLGFVGTDSTGLHVHVSYKEKVNREGYVDLFKRLNDKYSAFSSLAYMTSRESDYFFQQGDYARKDKQYSRTLDNKMQLIGVLMRKVMIQVAKEIKRQVQTKGNNLVIDLSPYLVMMDDAGDEEVSDDADMGGASPISGDEGSTDDGGDAEL